MLFIRGSAYRIIYSVKIVAFELTYMEKHIYDIPYMFFTQASMTPLTLFKCLADETRLKSLLLINLQQELCVCDLQAVLDISQPKISRHLAELRKCQLLIDERRGKWVYYRLHPQLPDWAVEILTTIARNNPDFLKESLDHFKHAGCGTSCEK